MDLYTKESKFSSLLIVALGIIFFIPFLGSVHLFDWDEINFAESAREMLLTGNYTRVQVNFEPFWEKPPLFFWMQSLSMHLFGINEFAARFPNAIIGIATLLVFYQLGKKHVSHQFGMLWVMLYIGSFLPHIYFKSGIIDPAFNLFIFLGVYYLWQTIEQGTNQHKLNPFLAGLFTGLSVLTKGPVGFLLVLLTFLVFWIFNRFKKVSTWQNVAVFALTIFFISSFWFGLETIKNGPWFLVEFITYQIRLFSTADAGHKQPFYYHFAVVLIGCFPMSVFAIKPLFKKFSYKNSDLLNFRKWMIYLFWVVMILFTIVKTKIVHYSSMAYFPVAFLAAYHLHYLTNQKGIMPLWTRIFNLVVGIIFSLLLAALPFLMDHKELLIEKLNDPYAVASLSVDVPMQGWEFAIGLVYLAMVVINFLLYAKGNIKKGLTLISISTGVTLMLYIVYVVPKVEAYSQRPAISFYEELQGKDVYVETIGFKSYADLYYFRKQPGGNENQAERDWLLEGPIDKPAYFVLKANKQYKIEGYPDIEKLYEKGGFAFYKRPAVVTP